LPVALLHCSASITASWGSTNRKFKLTLTNTVAPNAAHSPKLTRRVPKLNAEFARARSLALLPARPHLLPQLGPWPTQAAGAIVSELGQDHEGIGQMCDGFGKGGTGIGLQAALQYVAVFSWSPAFE
jgi:hypothetical protein